MTDVETMAKVLNKAKQWADRLPPTYPSVEFKVIDSGLQVSMKYNFLNGDTVEQTKTFKWSVLIDLPNALEYSLRKFLKQFITQAQQRGELNRLTGNTEGY